MKLNRLTVLALSPILLLVLLLSSAASAVDLPAPSGLSKAACTDSALMTYEKTPGVFRATSCLAVAKYAGTKLPGLGFDTVAAVNVLDTATGFSTVVTDTMRCLCSSAFASCSLKAGFTGTSNATSLTITTLPPQCRPTNTKLVQIPGVTNNSVKRGGLASIASTGVVTISKTDSVGVTSATFVNTGTKALDAGIVLEFPKN